MFWTYIAWRAFNRGVDRFMEVSSHTPPRERVETYVPLTYSPRAQAALAEARRVMAHTSP